jgi:hypothetical protein
MWGITHTEFRRMNDSYAGWPMDRGAFAWEPVIGVNGLGAGAQAHEARG